MKILVLLSQCPSWVSQVPLAAGLGGSVLLYLASFLLFPYVFTLLDGIRYSSSMVLLGTLLLAVSVMWEVLRSWFCCQTTLKRLLVQIIELLGWIAFLVGAVLGSPHFDLRFHRDLVYSGALSSLLVVQIIKISTLIFGSSLPPKKAISKHELTFYSQVYWTLALFLYLLGTLVFLKSEYRPYLSIVGSVFYAFGGASLLISMIYKWKNKEKIPKSKEKAEIIELEEEKSCQIGAWSKREANPFSSKQDTNGGEMRTE